MPVMIKNGRQMSLLTWLKAVSSKRGIIAGDEYFATQLAGMSDEEIGRLTKLKDADAVLLNAWEAYAKKHKCSEREARAAFDIEYNERHLMVMADKNITKVMFGVALGWQDDRIARVLRISLPAFSECYASLTSRLRNEWSIVVESL